MGVSAAYIDVIDERDRGPFVFVAPDLYFPRYATITVTDDERSDVDVDMRLVFDAVAAKYVVDSLAVTRRSASMQVDGASLRTIPVQEYMRSLEWAAKISGSDERVPNPLPSDLVELIKRAGPADGEGLKWLARVYVVAHALSQPPAKAVQESFRMPAPTASVWIRRARDRGLLPDSAQLAEHHMTDEDFEASKRALRDG